MQFWLIVWIACWVISSIFKLANYSPPQTTKNNETLTLSRHRPVDRAQIRLRWSEGKVLEWRVFTKTLKPPNPHPPNTRQPSSLSRSCLKTESLTRLVSRSCLQNRDHSRPCQPYTRLLRASAQQRRHYSNHDPRRDGPSRLGTHQLASEQVVA